MHNLMFITVPFAACFFVTHELVTKLLDGIIRQMHIYVIL